MRKQALTIALCYVGITSAYQAGDSFYMEAAVSDTVTTRLREVEVISAREKREITSATPLQNIDSEAIRMRGVVDISDAMRRLAGVNLRDYGGAGGMKTVSVRGLGAAHTTVMYDGAALSDCQTGEIDLSRYSLDNVRQIALYSGENDDIFIPARASAASASLYINTFDLPGVFDEGVNGRVQFTTGSFGLYNPFARIESHGEKLDFSVNAEYIHSRNDYPFKLKNGSIITRERRENSMMNAWKGEVNLRRRFSNGTTMGGKLYFYDNSRRLPGPVIYYVSESNERLHDLNWFGQLNFKRKFNSRLSLSALAKFNWSSTRYQDKAEMYPGGRLDSRYIQRETYLSAALLYLPADGLSLDYSADWMLNNLTSNKAKGVVSPRRNGILQCVAAKYRTGRLSLLGKLLYSIYINGAKEGNAGEDTHRLSPALSVSYRLLNDAGLYLRASYKNIFRMPTFNEAFFDNYGSINLKPEVTDQFNVGLTFERSSSDFLKNITATADGYHNIVSNKIVALPYNMFLWTMSNLGKVKVWGADVSLAATFGLAEKHDLLIVGSYTYQRAKVRTSPDQYDWNKQVAYTPLNSGSGSMTWRNPWVDIALHATASGSRYTTNNNLAASRLPGYVDAGATLLKEVRLGRYKIDGRFDLLNIFDTQYEIVARYPMPGRSWKVSLGFEF